MFILTIILFLGLVFWEGFITFNSRQIGHLSEARSQTSLTRWLNWQKKWPHFLQTAWHAGQKKLTHFFYPLYPELVEQSAQVFEHFLIRKLAHMTQFMILTLLLLAFWQSLALPWYDIIIYSLALTLLASVIDEFVQHFVPKRSASVIDVLVDFSGGLIAAFGYSLIILFLFLT